jgi:protein CWC15
LKRDLKAELAEAERKAIEKKRKAAGLPDFEVANNGALRLEDEESKRRRVDEVVDLDKDDESDDGGEAAVNGGSGMDKGKGKAVDVDEDEDEEDDEDDDEWV